MNSNGIGKFESLTVCFVLIVLLAGGLFIILKMSKNTKYETMNKSSLKFADSIKGSDNPFRSYKSYYLVQALDEGVLTSVKSPFSNEQCDAYESRIDFDSPNYYISFKCGDYLIKDRKSTDSKYEVYKVGKWMDTRSSKDDQRRVVYSCNDCGVDGYYEEPVFVYLYNKENNMTCNFIDEIKIKVHITNKEKFRNIKLVFLK